MSPLRPPENGRVEHSWHLDIIEFTPLTNLARQHPYVAMDTEFPGVVARPYGTFRSHTDYQYQTLKCNVDLLRIIQV